MAKPTFIFDSGDLIVHQKLLEIDFSVVPIGKPRFIHFKYK